LRQRVPRGIRCLVGGGGALSERGSRRGNGFYSCNRYPECTFVVWDKPVLEPCPRCGAPFVTEKVTKRSGTVRRCAREGCGWQARLDEEEERWVEMAAPRAAARVRRGGAARTAARGQEGPGPARPGPKKAAAKGGGPTGGAAAGTMKDAGGKAAKKTVPARGGGRARRAST